MDITMIGLQNAGKTSLLRVLAVSPTALVCVRDEVADSVDQGGEFTIEYVARQQHRNRCNGAVADRALAARYRQ